MLPMLEIHGRFSDQSEDIAEEAAKIYQLGNQEARSDETKTCIIDHEEPRTPGKEDE